MFMFNGTQISSPPPPTESSCDHTTVLPPIPMKHSPSRHSEDDDDLQTTAAHEEAMPSEFYANVDHFLSLNPPSLKTMLGGKKKGEGGGRPSIQQLKNDRSKLRKNKSTSTTSTEQPNSQSKRRSSGGVDKKKVASEVFDYGLLAEAMKFTDGLKKAEREEIQLEEPGRLAGGSPPRQGNPITALRRKKESAHSISKGAKGVKASKPTSMYESSQRSKSSTKVKRRPSSGNAFESGNKGGTSNVTDRTDIDSLVQNFEQGLELSRLRAELEASKQRFQDSTSAIKTAASEFYGPPPHNH